VSSTPQRESAQQGSAIAFRGVSRFFAGAAGPAVDDVSFEIAPGELIVLLGSSGSGKTTLLRMINRLEEPTSGTIHINGQDTTSLAAAELRRQIGYVIQQAGLFPHLKVRDNIAVVPRLLKWDRQRIRQRVDELLDLVGLPASSFGSRYPAQLSGGEQQRVGLARALAARPATLLMDEPFGALDAITRRRLQDELLRIHRELSCTIIFVTHDVDEALRLADRIAVMRHGRLLQVDTPLALLSTPRDEFVADLIGARDVFRRLQLLPVTQVMDPASPSGGPLHAPIPASGTALEALNVLLLDGAAALDVTGTGGDVVGQVTLASLDAHLRAGARGGQPERVA
jgi:osmoprotectant transport system ATP-binding protein